MLTSFQTESCMGQIVRSRPPVNCSFNFINNGSGIQKQSLDSATYLFFPRPISLSFTCPPQEADGLEVVGRMLVPPVCSVIAGQIRLLGVRSTNLKLAQSAVGNATVYDPQHQFTRHIENLRNRTLKPLDDPEPVVVPFIYGSSNYHEVSTVVTGIVVAILCGVVFCGLWKLETDQKGCYS